MPTKQERFRPSKRGARMGWRRRWRNDSRGEEGTTNRYRRGKTLEMLNWLLKTCSCCLVLSRFTLPAQHVLC